MQTSYSALHAGLFKYLPVCQLCALHRKHYLKHKLCSGFNPYRSIQPQQTLCGFNHNMEPNPTPAFWKWNIKHLEHLCMPNRDNVPKQVASGAATSSAMQDKETVLHILHHVWPAITCSTCFICPKAHALLARSFTAHGDRHSHNNTNVTFNDLIWFSHP